LKSLNEQKRIFIAFVALFARLFCSQFVFEHQKRKNYADLFVIVSIISHKHICLC